MFFRAPPDANPSEGGIQDMFEDYDHQWSDCTKREKINPCSCGMIFLSHAIVILGGTDKVRWSRYLEVDREDPVGFASPEKELLVRNLIYILKDFAVKKDRFRPTINWKGKVMRNPTSPLIDTGSPASFDGGRTLGMARSFPQTCRCPRDHRRGIPFRKGSAC